MGCSSLHTIRKTEVRTKSDFGEQQTINTSLVTSWVEFKECYEIIELIGTDRFGDTFKCAHRKKKSLHTVKIIRKKALTTETIARAVIKELKILMSLKNPYILQVEELFEDSKKYYLVMEENRDSLILDEITRQTNHSELMAKKIMYQLLCAVDYLNTNKITNIDLKPDSISLRLNESELRVKVLSYSTENIVNSNIIGRISHSYYMPPTKNDTSLQVWCSGVTMYILLAGYPPFQGTSLQEISENIRLVKYDLESNPWPQISKQCKSLMRNLLCKDYRRIKIGQALRHPWFSEGINEESSGWLFDSIDLTHVLSAMREFNSYISILNTAESKHIFSDFSVSDFKSIRALFKKIDLNHDGRLSREELMNEYVQIMTKEEARKQIEIIFDEVDTISDNYIGYTEFVNIMIDIWRQKPLSKSINQLFRNC